MALLVHGIAEGTVEAGAYCIASSGLTAICSPLDQDLNALFQDPEAVAALAVSHNGVLTEAAAVMDVLPLRLGTVCRDEAGVRSLVAREGDRFREGLSHIADALEMGVRISVDLAGPQEGTAQDTPQSGRDYLRRRAKATAHRRSMRDDRKQFIQSVVETLSPFTRDVRALPQAKRTDADAPERLMDAAFLVRRPHREAFAERVEALAAPARHHGLNLSLNGPWPAYNFMPEAA